MSLCLDRSTASKRRTRGRRACFVVLSGVAVFVALQLGAAAAAEVWFPGLIDPTYGNQLQRIRQGRAADPRRTRTVVMLGSSRTFVALRSDVVKGLLSRDLGRPVSVANLGKTAAGPLSELLTWRRLRRDGVRPDLLLVEVLPAHLCQACRVDETSEERMPAFRVRWCDLPLLERYGPGNRSALRAEVALADLTALSSRRIGILYAVAPRLLLGLGNPSIPLIEPAGPGMLRTNPTPEMRAKALEHARREYSSILQATPAPSIGCDALRELLSSCGRDGVPVALVLLPEGPTFRGWYAPETWNWIHSWLEQTARENGAALINAREWIDEDEFLDSHHLLPNGAKMFSERLAHDAVLPFLRHREARQTHRVREG